MQPEASVQQTPLPRIHIRLSTIHQTISWLDYMLKNKKFPLDLDKKIKRAINQLKAAICSLDFERLMSDEILLPLEDSVREEMFLLWRDLERLEGNSDLKGNPFSKHLSGKPNRSRVSHLKAV